MTKLKINSYWKAMQSKIIMLLSPKPEIENDYVDKVVYLLRRDFDVRTQNDILLQIGKKLSEAREADMVRMESDYRMLNENYALLNSKMAY